MEQEQFYDWIGPAEYYAKAWCTYQALRSKKRHLGYAGQYVDQLFRDLQAATSGWPLRVGNLLSVEQWNLSALLHRPNRYGGMSKPRVELEAEVTSRWNLAMRWRPAGWDRGRSNQTDFSDWVARHHNSAAPFERPSNEIAFIREISALHGLASAGNEELARQIGFTCQSIYHTIYRFLDQHLEVEKTRDIELRYKDGELYTLETFSISERAQQEADAWLASFEEQYGLNVNRFLEIFARHPGWNADEKASRAFKALGLPLTPKPVRDAVEKIKQFHPALYARYLGPIEPSGQGGATIVSLQHKNSIEE